MYKTFDLKAAKAGAPVQTRDGRAVRILCFDRKGVSHPIVALLTDTDGVNEVHASFHNNGMMYHTSVSPADLVMPSTKTKVKVERWFNIYTSFRGRIITGNLFPSEHMAIESAKTSVYKLIKIVHIVEEVYI